METLPMYNPSSLLHYTVFSKDDIPLHGMYDRFRMDYTSRTERYVSSNIAIKRNQSCGMSGDVAILLARDTSPLTSWFQA